MFKILAKNQSFKTLKSIKQIKKQKNPQGIPIHQVLKETLIQDRDKRYFKNATDQS